MRQLYALLSPPFSLSSMYLHFFYSSPFTGTSEVGLASPTKWLPPAAYDPRLLSDYGGTVFDHSRAKLVQRNITDCTALSNILIYADRISMALPSEEAVDVRAIKNVDVDGPDKSGDTYDSDDDILNSFNVVVESTNANCSTASSVSVYDICSIPTFASQTFLNSVKPH